MIDAPADPIDRFVRLLDQAKALPRSVLPEPTAFALGTVDGRGNPSDLLPHCLFFVCTV